MRCDKLKPLKNLEVAFNRTTGQEQVIAEDSEGNCYGFDSWEEVYLKDEVDAAIDELKTENESLLQQNRELCLSLQVMYSKEEYDKQKAEHHKERHEYIKMIAELKNENERLKKQSSCTFSDDCLRVRQLKSKVNKLLGCLKYLVMRDLIKDIQPNKIAAEIVQECDNGIE